jgi:uncharacterized membrane protein
VRAIDVTGDGTADVGVNNSVGFSVLLNNTTAATGTPLAQFSDLTLSYGSIVEGASQTMAVTLANTGTGPLTLTQWSFANNTGNQFAVTQWQCGTTSQPPYPIYLTPTSSCTFSITYTPNALGVINAQIIFYDNASASNAPTAPATGAANFQQTINLTGAGLQAQANVSINVSVSPIPVLVGTEMIYTIKLTNSGPNPATNLNFTHQFEPSVLFASSSTSQGSCSGPQAYGALVTCPMGTLPVGSTATIQLYVSPSVATTLTNGFSITEDEADSNPETVSHNVTVVTSLTVTIPTVTENIAVSDTPTFPDIPVSEPITVSDKVFVTPLLNNFTPPAAAFSASVVGFNGDTTVPQTLTLQSVGGLPILFVNSFNVSSGFSVTTLCSDGSTTQPASLASGGECVFTITDAGTQSTGTITFTDNAALSSPASTPSGANYVQTIQLNGAGASNLAPPPSATVTIPTIYEPIQVTDTPVVSNTEGGINVTVTPVDTTTGTTPVTLTFTKVTQPGVTTLTTGTSGPQAPPGFQPGNPGTYYEISTTAVYTGPVTICINYAGTTFTQQPQIFHYQNGAWALITISFSPTSTGVCGTTTSFSPFALFQLSAFPTTTAISAASVTYGTPASVTVSVSSAGGTVTGSVLLSVDGGPASTLALSSGSASFSLGVLNAGSHSLSANFATQGNFLASSATGTISVALAPLTITANGNSRPYGAADPAFTVSYSGFVNGDGPSSLSGKLTCTAGDTASSPVGSYAINCSGLSSPNYTISYVPGTLTITRAPLTITAYNATKTLNAPNPTLGWTASGFVNGENSSVLTATPTCATTATTTSPVGSYSINCSGANATNYMFTYVPGTLKIVYAPNVGHVIQPPINTDGTSVFKQGRTVPAKFSVYDANGVSIGTSGVVSSFFLTGILSGTTTTTVETVVDTNNPDTSFRWDPTGQQWIFNITTANLTAGNTYIYTIALNDGTTVVFQYGLR